MSALILDGWMLSGQKTFVSHWVLVIRVLHHFTKNQSSRGGRLGRVEPAPTPIPVTFLSEAFLVTKLNPRNVRFGLRDPNLVQAQAIYIFFPF